MLDLLNRYGHGYVSIPPILACRKRGLFEILKTQPGLNADQLANVMSANSGHFRVALRTLASLGWIHHREDGKHFVTEQATAAEQIPAEITELLSYSFESYLCEGDSTLSAWLEQSATTWGLGSDPLGDLLDGMIIIPLFLAIRQLCYFENDTLDLRSLPKSTRKELLAYLESKTWVLEGTQQLTDQGAFLLNRILNMGVTASYAPMLSKVDALLFGNPKTVFQRDEEGHEQHVDRTLNVIGSGFQHDKYFADIDEIVIDIFSLPIEKQPKFVADMGCGNGALLSRIYHVVRDRTPRGQQLDQHPLTLIGIDFNQKSLEATSQTLEKLPHMVMHGDIGDPTQLAKDLRARDIELDSVLHIRSFLDHDRPFRMPRRKEQVAQRHSNQSTGVFVDESGSAIPSSVAVQSLVEHLEGWAELTQAHGLILLEVHCLAPEAIRANPDLTENLHFDAYHAYSKQYLVESDVFLMAAAEAGLLPNGNQVHRYPQTLPFSRITLTHFKSQAYAVRLAQSTDLDALEELERQCWPSTLRVSRDEILNRIQRHPHGQCVMVRNREIVGVLYSQRIDDIQGLQSTAFSEIATLHRGQGSIVQLLALNVLPKVQDQGLGDQLIRFFLSYLKVVGNVDRVVGITRCQNYTPDPNCSYPDYVSNVNNQDLPIDPILYFHVSRGARILEIVRDYRPDDVSNEGCGVLIEYPLNDQETAATNLESTSSTLVDANLASTVVPKAIKSLMGEKRAPSYSAEDPLMELGLDSLDFLELRTLLSKQLGVKLDPTFFFRYSTASAIIDYFGELDTAPQPEATVVSPGRSKPTQRSKPSSKPDESSHINKRSTQAEPGQDKKPTSNRVLPKPDTPREPRDCRDDDEDSIAIIGMACRFPGDVETPDDFWALLRDGIDAIKEVPANRWDIDAYLGEGPGCIKTRFGGFIKDVDQFDAPFFRIAPVEAKAMDPQQRLLLESHWEALENAGIDPTSLAGTNASVYVGIFGGDYQILQLQNGPSPGAYFGTGTSSSIAAGRIAYFLGTTGPAVAIQTACSSSLVAVHSACENLRSGNSRVALASGVNLLLAPELSIAFSQADNMLAPDGRCKTFDAAANGYVRSEGCATVVLKRLKDAQADDDPILAVIRGSAVNQDGASNGLTAPNGKAQEALIRQALDAAKIPSQAVSYIEAHGTGTILGDPIEVKALEAVYGENRNTENPLYVGSVKTNIGHAEAAAGIAGLIKLILSLTHKTLPPHLHFKRLNPLLDSSNIRVTNKGIDWAQPQGGRRTAAVSSFGFSGTNAHVILEEAPALARPSNNHGLSSHLIAISAKTREALRENVQRFTELFGNTSDERLPEIAFTSQSGKSHFEHRVALIASSCSEAKAQAEAICTSGLPSGTQQQETASVKAAFLFTGQGSQFLNMGRDLFDSNALFRQHIERADKVFQHILNRSLVELLYPDAKPDHNDLMDSHPCGQAANFAVQCALADLWKSWGIQPSLVLGHSLGDFAAAYTAGGISLEDGLKLVTVRGRLMETAKGSMALVLAPENEVTPFLKDVHNVTIGAINGPNSVTLSGDSETVEVIVKRLNEAGHKTNRLSIPVAAHSPMLDPALDSFETAVRMVTLRKPNIPVISSITGEMVTNELTDPSYWRRHLRDTVRFASAMATVHQEGCNVLLEIGPQPSLLFASQAIYEAIVPEAEEFSTDPTSEGTADNPLRLASLREKQSAWHQMLTSLGALYEHGAKINWDALYPQPYPQKIALPNYPFQRQRYWIESDAKPRQTPNTPIRHLLHEVSWKQSNPPSIASSDTKQRWLVLSEQDGLGVQIQEQLQAHGHEVQLMSFSASETKQGIQDGCEAIQQFLETDPGPWHGMIHCPDLDSQAEAFEDGTALLSDQQRRCGTLLALLRSAPPIKANAKEANPTPIWILTRGAQQVSQSSGNVLPRPHQASLWGLGRVASLECPERWGGLIDLDPSTSATKKEMALQVLSEICSPDGEEQIAYRNGHRYVARLNRAQPRQAASTGLTGSTGSIQDEAIYLITGGLGALGLHLAAWLCRQGAKHLILAGRKGITQTNQQQAIAQLESQGVKVRVAKVDVADSKAMEDLFQEIGSEGIPLKGIIHAAGSSTFKPLSALTWDELETVFQPKLVGAWHLHQLSLNLDLDFFVAFSSGAGIWGGKQQGHYGAANHALDGLVGYRRQLGLPGLSIAWGPWAGGGMASDESLEIFESMGIKSLTPQQGTTIVGNLLNSDASHITAADVEWETLNELYTLTKARPFLADLARSESARSQSTSPDPSGSESSSLHLDKLLELPENRRLDWMQRHLQDTVKQILGMDTVPDPKTGFADLGMDSLMALELRRRLERLLGKKLPTTVAFEHPRIATLAQHLVSSLLPQSTARITHEQAPRPQGQARSEDSIAVVGMACRFPGASTPERFWELLRDGVDLVGEIPSNRWDVDKHFDPARPLAGKMYTRNGAFLEEGDQFDPLFFGIAPREAETMDPQHGLLLEMCWEALERTGIAQESVVESRSGVFVGIGSIDYGCLSRNDSWDELDIHAITSGSHSVAAGRIAHALGLQGPTMAVDTACSSSLLALHLACQSLQNGESDLALAGGVNLILSPVTYIALSQMQAISSDGRCKSFDASADGFGRGEGGGIVVLKRLAEAERDGDQILAVIKGGAVNHDGPASGLTVPSKTAQEKLLRQALENAHLKAGDVDYIEAHGTGTPLGDPIEMRALETVFGAQREKPLNIGTVKTNIAHLEAAAGIAGFIKTVLSIQHGEIPPHLHLTQPSPHIDWENLPFEIPTKRRTWSSNDSKSGRIAGVSSFGISGTNVHLLVGSPQQVSETTSTAGEESNRPHLLPLSARSGTALKTLADRYIAAFEKHETLPLADLAFTAATGRNHFQVRKAICYSDPAELLTKLNAFSQNQAKQEQAQSSQTAPRTAFLFTGQGSQYPNMGRSLYEEPSRFGATFREVLGQCNQLLAKDISPGLFDVIHPNSDELTANSLSIHQTTYTQPALFALEYALAKQWQSWGIEPEVLIGHSVGELAAACFAGVFSLEDGLKLIAARGRLMGALTEAGQMLSLRADEQTVLGLLKPYRDQVSIAAINGPESIVISGAQKAISEIEEIVSTQGIRARQLTVSHAFHSPLMEPILNDFRRVAESLTYHSPKYTLVSNVTGTLESTALAKPDYWVQHVRATVRFADGIQTVIKHGANAFIEVGPKPTLLSMAAQIPNADSPFASLPSLSENVTDRTQMLTSLADLYELGAPIHWDRVIDSTNRKKLILPSYPFERQRYWKPLSTVQRASSKAPQTKAKANTKAKAKATVASVPEEPTQDLIQALGAMVGKSLRLKNTAELLENHEANLLEFGLDSMIALEIRNNMRSQWGVNIRFDQFMEGVSLKSLVQQIEEQQTTTMNGPSRDENAPTSKLISEDFVTGSL